MNLTDRPTPETDEAQFGTGRVSVSFARRLEQQRDALRDALIHIEEYWNQSENDRVIADALWEIKETAAAVLAEVKGVA